LLAIHAVIEHFPVLGVLNVNPGLTAENGGTASSLVLASDALSLAIVPVLGF